MKKKVKVFKRSILSLLLCLSLVVSPLAGTGLVVSAEESVEKTSDEETTAKDSAEETTPAPEEEATQTPEEEATPAPEEEATPAPEAEEATPAPEAEEATPAPEEEATPAPEEEATPAPEEEAIPAPEEEATPAPEEEATPAPEEAAASAPEEEAASAPEEEAQAPAEEVTSAPEEATPASAEAVQAPGEGVAREAEGTYYSQDFSGVSTPADVGAKANYAANHLTIASDELHGGYLSLTFGSGTDPDALNGYAKGPRGAMLRFNNGSALSISDTKYIVEFDALIKASTTSGKGAAIAVVSANVADSKMNADVTDNYIVKIASTAGAFTINGVAASLSETNWYHYKIYVDTDMNQVSTTVTSTDAAKTVIVDKMITVYGAGDKGSVAGLYLLSQQGNDASILVDDVKVCAPKDSDEFGEVKYVTVSYDLQGHGTEINSEQVVPCSKVKEPTAPEEAGWVFKGWYKEAECTTAWDFAKDIVLMDKVTIYAKWMEAQKAPVSFDMQGHGTSDEPKEYLVGDLVTKPTAPREEGFVFMGWYKEAGCTTAWDFATDTVPADGATIYAKWIVDPAESYPDAPYAQTFSKVTGFTGPTSFYIHLTEGESDTGIMIHNTQRTGDPIGVDEKHGYYLSHTIVSGSGGRDTTLNFSSALDEVGDQYTVEFDAAINPIKYCASTLYIKAANTEILKLYAGSNGTTYTINDGSEKVTIPAGQWCHYLLEIDSNNKTVKFMITGSDMTEKKSITYSGDGKPDCLQMNFAKAGANFDASFFLDNVVVKAVDPAPEIIGAESITKVNGQTVEKTYTVTGVEGETFTWAVKAEAEGGSIAGITISDGKLSVADTAAAGKYTITATSNKDNARVAEFEVEIFNAVSADAKNFLVLDATGDTTAIDSSQIISKATSEFITGYQITIADASKKLMSQAIVETLPASVDTKGAAKVEIAPVYVTNIDGVNKDLLHLGGNGDDSCNIELPEAGTYDFKVTNTSNIRSDVYVNGQILVNNLLQHGSTPNYAVVKDIVLTDKVAKIRTDDYGSGDASSQKLTIQIVKSPEIVNRVRKVYVLGDSLVAVYYNDGKNNKDAQTGWGQLLQNYLNDSVEVVDLANSGSTAHSLEPTAFTQIRGSAQAGDILLLESGYNDRDKEKNGYFDNGGTDNYMAVALKKMVSDALNKNMTVVLVSPNASQHDYKGDVSWTGRMEEVVTELKASGKQVDYIDLSQLSYDFLEETYGSDGEAVKEILLADWNITSDRLHSKYGAAHKWASVVAGALKEIPQYADIVNTEYYYTFSDMEGRTIFCTAGEIPANLVVTLTYEMNGHGKQYPSTKVVKGEKLKALAPTEKDYAFKGWYKDKELTQKWDFAKDTVGNVDFTLYAKWVKQEGVLYSQDFEEVEAASSVASSPNAGDKLKIATDQDHGKYFTFDFAGDSTTNSRSADMNFTVSGIAECDAYIVEFDAAITPGNKDGMNFAVKGTEFAAAANSATTGGYIFSLTSAGSSSAEYTINGVAEAKVTIPKGTWYHYKLYVDKKLGMVSTTITGADGAALKGADKLLTSYDSKTGDVSGIYLLAGRYQAVYNIDNIMVRKATEDDEFGELPEDEPLSSAVFTAPLNCAITQTKGGAPQHFPVIVQALGTVGGDITDKVSIKWSMGGMDKADGYISLTKAEGTENGTTGVEPDGATAYFNVRDGVGNLFGYVQAEVTYKDKTCIIRTPVAVLGSTDAPANRLAPLAGYPISMDEFGDSLIGYQGTANTEKAGDLVLNNWSIYGSNSARSFSLEEVGGKKALKFAANVSDGSTVAVYPWTKQSGQYVMDLTVNFTAAMTFGVYTKTPNNGSPGPEWEVSYNAGELKLGTESISGINANEWYRVVVSADPSINKVSMLAYDSKGNLCGSVEDVDMGSSDAKYFAFNGTFPMYLNSFEAYKPLVGTLTVNSTADTLKVPEAGETEATLKLTASLLSTEGLKMTGAVDWMLAEDYPNVEIESDGAQGATLKVAAGASGTVTVIAAKDGKQAEKEIRLTTSSNVVSFKKSTSSITIPFAGEKAVVSNFEAVTLDKDSKEIDGGTITYSLLGKDGVTPLTTLPKGVTFEKGVLTVAPGASPAVIWVKAVNGEGLSARANVNIHGLCFAFGSADAEEGFTQVTKDLYTTRLGYGFYKTDGLTVNADNVKGTEEFRFKATVPNGNYTVKVDTTAANMTSEVVESVTTIATGINKTGGTFNVAVCDGVLDLTFPAGASVKTLEISQAAAKTALAKPYIYAIGDSTAKNTDKGAKSWGNCAAEGLVDIPEVFGGFANHGMAGRNSVSFYNEGRVEAVLLAICPGDYVTVNMGINSETGEPAAYETMIRDYYIQGILQRGGIPVIVTATPDGPVGDRLSTNYNSTTGKFTNNRGNGAQNDTLRKIAKELDVKLIELGQWGQDWMNSLTADDLKAYNAAYMTNYKTVLEMVQSWYVDHNHYKEYLGKQIAWYLFTELAKMAGGEGPERPTLPEPQGGSIIEDFETTTDWELTGKLVGSFSVVSDGKGGHYLQGNGAEVGAGDKDAKKVFADLPDMETAEISLDWIANSAELKTTDKAGWYALQLWSEESELVSLYVSDLRGNAAADVYYSTTGINDKQKTNVTLKQGQTLKVKFALNFATHTLDIYLDDAKVASGVSFDALTTKVDTFAIATLGTVKTYPNFAIDNFSLTYLNSKGPQDLSKLVKSVKPMGEKDHGKVSNMAEFVHPTKATVVLGDGTEMEMDINAATWSVDKTVDFAEIGTYTWTAGLIMPEGYSNPNNVRASYVMNYLADFLKTDIDALDPIAVVTLTKAEYEAGYKHPEKVTAKLVSGKKVAIEIDQSTWTCEPAFDKAVRGIYVWTAQLKNNGTNGNPRNLKVSYTMHYQADWVSTHDIEEDFLFGYPGWTVWGKDIDNTSGTGGFGFELKKDGDNPYLYATEATSGKNRGSRMNLSEDIVKGAVMEFDFMPAVVGSGTVDLLFVAPAYKQNYLSLLVNANGKVSYHTTEDLDGSGGHPKNNDFDGVISKDSPVATGVGAIGKWMHVKLECDYLAHTASLTVTSKENPAETYTVSDIPIDDRANGLSIMVLRKPGSCSRAEVAFDNVIVDYDKFSDKDIVKLTQFKDVNVAESQFDEFVFPTEVEATLGDNSKVMVPVSEWTATPAFERGKPGTYVWTAEIKNEEMGLTNYFDLSLSFTMTYTMLPFPVYVFNPNTLELKFGEAWSSEQLPAEVDAKMSDESSRKVKVGEWTAIREFNANDEGIYVYGANVIPVDGDYDVLKDKLSPNENPNRDKLDDKEKYVYDVYYRISYAKDDNDNYNGYKRTMENLDRGVYAVAVNGGVFVSWRLLATEYGTNKNVSFDVYRNGVKVNSEPITSKTNFVDAAGKAGDVYTVVKTQENLTYEGAQATASSKNYMSIPVQKPEPQQNKNGDLSAYTLNDMGVADVDGDGEYEIIVKWYPDNGFDSGSAVAPSSPTIFDLYEMDGTPLWRLNLGLELPSGAHFNQFMLYDLDEDGKAELFIKTSDGSITYKPNAEGKFDMDDESTIVSYIGDRNVKPGTNVNSNGHVNDNSNEYVTVFNGLTGEEISTIGYINTTGNFTDWGTTSGGGEDGGNRSARYNIAIAYLPKAEGSTETIPAVLFNRGYYDKTTVAAYTLRDGGLKLEWNFVATNGTQYAGKGNHNVATGDIDKDGFDEIILGAIAIDHDGTVLWAKDGKEGQDFAAHADSIHLSAMNPYSNDLYVFTPNEEATHSTMNAAVVNARTGARISGVWFTVKDVGRAVAANITPRPGFEYWSASTGSGIYAFDGSTVANTIPVAMNWRMYWDGDLLSELGDGVATDGNWAVTKYNWGNNTVDTLAVLEGSKTNNYTKKTPGLTADLFGDWREEVMLRNDDDTEIRIYMTTEETDYMIYTLMHDPVYRNAVANQNTSYNQPPHLGFYLGEDNKDTVLAMGLPTANIKYGTPQEVGSIAREEKITKVEPQDTVPEPTEEIKKALLDKKIVCNTAEDLKTYLRNDVISKILSTANIRIPAQNTLVQEIKIQVSLDGGKTYQDATPNNFPKEGVKIILPYPKGTNGKEYNFTVSHLITMNCNGFTVGQVVQEKVNKTDQGLEMVVMSASPFAIGWYKIGEQPTTQPGQNDQDDKDDEDDQGGQSNPVNPDVPVNPDNPVVGDEPVVNTSDDKVSVPAKTGDHMGSILWLCIALIAVAVAGIAVTVFMRYRRKK